MILLQSHLTCPSSKLGIDFKKPLSLNLLSTRVSFKCCSAKIGSTAESSQLLSVLVLQTLELIGASLILKIFHKPKYNILDFFRSAKLSNERNRSFASFLGLGFFVLVFFTSIIADQFIGLKDVNDPILKQILCSGSVSVTACTLLYCIVAPLVEETVYRGFLLTSLASTMDWKQAVFISSLAFSGAHLSGENFVQLFLIGSVLGCSYCWTGKLSSAILIHSLYNALTLFSTFAS